MGGGAEIEGGVGSQTRWHAWALCAPDAVVYRIQEGRDAQAARDMLKDFSAILMVDGLSTYESVAAGAGGKLSLVNCWMHVRRKYVECAQAFPQANEALERWLSHRGERPLPLMPCARRQAPR